MKGCPPHWVQRMRRSMSALVERFSADRTVREYTEQYYLPMATAYRRRCADGSALASRCRTSSPACAATGMNWPSPVCNGLARTAGIRSKHV